MGGWGAGLRLSMARVAQGASGLQGQRTRPRNPAGFLGPEWVGETSALPPPPILWSYRDPPHLPLLFQPPCPQDQRSWSGPWRVEDPTWEPSRLPVAQVGGGNASCVSPDPPVLEGPCPFTSVPLPPSSLPPLPLGPKWLEGASEVRGPSMGAQQDPQDPSGQGTC